MNRMIDMNQVYAQLDEMFANGQTREAEDYLIACMQKTQSQEDYNALIMLLNEMIGYCRETGQKEKSLGYSAQVIKLMQQLDMTDTAAYATTLLNVANACRAAGKLQESYQFYMEVFPLYEKLLEPDDFYYASLYNNLSLLFQETGEYDRAVECLEKALQIAENTPDKQFEVAVTHTNIAATLCKLSEQADEEERLLHVDKSALGYDKGKELATEAYEETQKAIAGFAMLEVADVHMAAAYAACADALVLLGSCEQARVNYEKALLMIKNAVGVTEGYHRVEEKLARLNSLTDEIENRAGTKAEAATEAKTEAGMETETEAEMEAKTETKTGAATGHKEMSGLALGRAYFEAYGRRMLFDEFNEYLDKIAVGICGEGSECLGYDDCYSRDHDFGPGFALWVSEETYAEIGARLELAYANLPKEFQGYRRIETEQAKGRCGVCTFGQYFKRITGLDHPPAKQAEWLYVDESALLAAMSGEIFCDPQGSFSALQDQIRAYYPAQVWHLKLAQEMTLFSQNGQYNYERMARRGDLAAANLLLVKAAENAINLMYLLNKKYRPHTKWLLRGLEDCDRVPMAEDLITGILHEIGTKGEQEIQQKLAQLEKLAGLLLEEMKSQGLLPSGAEDTYLAGYAQQIADGNTQPPAEEEMPAGAQEYTKQQLVDAVVHMEWKAFDQVKNEGGRAGCQDDWQTFRIMRQSQYQTWTREMLRQYIYDFRQSMAAGWNPITEKYARMMESTVPEKYTDFKDSLPEISPQKKAIMEEIIRVQVGWMEDFALRYPKVAGSARAIHTTDDTPYDTSYETYLRGELGTYSDEMLKLYGSFIVSLAKSGQNLAELTMEHTVHMYGYQTLAQAEEKMW